MDLEAYLSRVGLAGSALPPTVASLTRLHRAHVDAIPFVNVEPALGRVPSLAPDVLEQRLVVDGRGGYCLEHVGLFAAVLRSLGFGVGVRLCLVGDPAPGRPPTHLTVLADVEDDPRRWMADVGFGQGVLGPVPVPLSAGSGEPVTYGRWTHRADVLEDGRIALLERDGSSWRTLHVSFDGDPAADEVVSANTWVASQEGSPFAGRLVAMRTTEEARERLRGTTLDTATADDPSWRARELTAAEAVAALEERFGVRVDAADRAALVALLSG